MPPDLDKLEALMAHINGDSPCDHIRCMYAIVDAVPGLIAEVKRLREQLVAAKAEGAAEELERLAMWARSVALADDVAPGDWRDALGRIAMRRAAELRKAAR